MLLLKKFEQLNPAFQILNEFGKFARLVLNVDQTQTLYMVNQQNNLVELN